MSDIMLQRWIKGSEVRPGMTIVGNTGSNGNYIEDMWIAKIHSINKTRYGKVSDPIFMLDIEATYLDHKNREDESGEGVIWSHCQYLRVA